MNRSRRPQSWSSTPNGEPLASECTVEPGVSRSGRRATTCSSLSFYRPIAPKHFEENKIHMSNLINMLQIYFRRELTSFLFGNI
jgi:hypothetical protein